MIRKDDISMEHNYYLAHHGVKGQKWGGVRKIRTVRNGVRVPKKQLQKEREFMQEHSKEDVMRYLERNHISNKRIQSFHDDQLIDVYKKTRVRKIIGRAIGIPLGTIAGLATASTMAKIL